MSSTSYLLQMAEVEPVKYARTSDYADAVRQWLKENAFWYESQFRTLTQLQLVPFGVVPPPFAAVPPFPGAAAAPAAPQVNGFGQRTFRVPSFYRRVAAEAFDFIFAFIIKLFLVYIFVEMGAFELERYEKFFENSADLHTIIEITEELFPMELIGKVICSVVEAFCISRGFPRGQTPGKLLMNIRVVSCHTVQAGPRPDEVIVTGNERVPFINSLVRSLIKNLVINFLLPLSSVAYAFSHNRAVYDLAAKTLVVHAD